jgi:DNA-binding transcriptional LysR family regulator
MNLTQLRSLVAIADAGSFSGAAEAVGVTQSGMSQAIAALEDDLGVKLLVRQRHGVELTATGERVTAHARDVMERLKIIRQEADGERMEASGSIRLAGFPSVFATFLPPLFRRFRALHPAIELVALETDDREVEDWLASDAVDLGVVLNPSPERKAIIIGQDAWVPIFPASHHSARRQTVSFDELVMEPFVLATGGCDTNARSLAEAAGMVLADVKIEVRDWTSAIALVREGAGVSLVPESTLPESRRGLRVGTLKGPLFRTFGLVVSETGKRSRSAGLFLDMTQRLHNQVALPVA